MKLLALLVISMIASVTASTHDTPPRHLRTAHQLHHTIPKIETTHHDAARVPSMMEATHVSDPAPVARMESAHQHGVRPPTKMDAARLGPMPLCNHNPKSSFGASGKSGRGCGY